MDFECTICGGELILLGLLGPTAHFSCRNCGMVLSREAEEE